MPIKLLPHQSTALGKLANGSILVGSTGSGKSFVGLSYYYEKVIGGSIDPPIMPDKNIPIYVITTSRKRDDLDFEKAAINFGLSRNEELSINGIKFVVDSWNNIQKYKNVRGAFFLFDEQKAINYGAWGKTFIKIAKTNQWIMLSATPADRWLDLMPVFIAHGFYDHKKDFERNHVVFSPYVKYPSVLYYVNVDLLKKRQKSIYVNMPYKNDKVRIVTNVDVEYDQEAVKQVNKTEWNPFTDRPIRTEAEHRFTIRRIVYSHPSRAEAVYQIQQVVDKLIIFYNFDFELEILLEKFKGVPTAQYNGHKHEDIPYENKWVYLVQYNSGAEAWECFTTNHMAFYSTNYSYRVTTQAMGRIDRLTTTYQSLFYYRLLSNSSIDRAVDSAYQNKKDFNESTLNVKKWI